MRYQSSALPAHAQLPVDQATRKLLSIILQIVAPYADTKAVLDVYYNIIFILYMGNLVHYICCSHWGKLQAISMC